MAETDYYELLGIPANASESEVRRAYRKTSLLYHPDKVKVTPETTEKFQLLQVAQAVLTDADEKQKYDQSREAKLRRKAENDALEGRRRKLKEDLEAGEKSMSSGLSAASKRSWSQRDLDIKRIAEENRKKREAATLRKAQEAQEREKEEESTAAMDRSVKVQWLKEAEGLEVDQEFLEQTSEGIEAVLLSKKEKRRKIDGRKVPIGTAIVVFATRSAAQKAVDRGPWDGVESVTWASSKEDKGQKDAD